MRCSAGFPLVGATSVPADVMAAVITLQALHGLSDSETVDAVTLICGEERVGWHR